MTEIKDLDAHLESVMESHQDAPAAPAESGLRSYAERPSVGEEVKEARNKAASVNLFALRAEEKLSDFLYQRAEDWSQLQQALKQAADEHAAAQAEQAEMDEYIAALRAGERS
jgi:hypothetical protein